MKVNPLMGVCALLQVGASAWAVSHGNYRLALLYLSFGVGSAVLSTLG